MVRFARLVAILKLVFHTCHDKTVRCGKDCWCVHGKRRRQGFLQRFTVGSCHQWSVGRGVFHLGKKCPALTEKSKLRC